MCISARVWCGRAVLGGIAASALACGIPVGRTRVPVVRVTAGPFESGISTNGTIEPVNPQILRARVAAFVEAVNVVEGGAVKRDEPLVILDAAEHRAELARAREEVAKAENDLRLDEESASSGDRARIAADLKKAAADVAQLRRDHDALARLVAAQSATSAELEQTDLALARAEAARDALANQLRDQLPDLAATSDIHRLTLQRTREALRVAEARVAAASIRAPIDGTIYSLPVRAGTRVDVGTVIAEIADLGSVQLRAFVDVAELASIRTGQPVEVTWAAVPGRRWMGRTERLPKTITSRGDRRVGEVICSVANDDQQLLPNLDVDVRVRLQEKPQALLVPRRAVQSDRNGRYVFAVRDGVLHRVPVEIEGANPSAYAIRSGVREGDTLALPTTTELRDGLRVEAASDAD